MRNGCEPVAVHVSLDKFKLPMWMVRVPDSLSQLGMTVVIAARTDDAGAGGDDLAGGLLKANEEKSYSRGGGCATGM